MPCLAISVRILRAAVSEISIIVRYGPPEGGHYLCRRLSVRIDVPSLASAFLGRRPLLLLVVGNRRLDRVLSEHRTVNLDRRQTELGHDVGVLDREGLFDGLALEPLGGEARAGDGRSTPERLELRVV